MNKFNNKNVPLEYGKMNEESTKVNYITQLNLSARMYCALLCYVAILPRLFPSSCIGI